MAMRNPSLNVEASAGGSAPSICSICSEVVGHCFNRRYRCGGCTDREPRSCNECMEQMKYLGFCRRCGFPPMVSSLPSLAAPVHFTPKIMLLMDLNGVLVHRPRDGQIVAASSLPHIELPHGTNNVASYMYVRPEARSLLQKLVKVSERGCTWGFYTTMTHRNTEPIVCKLLSEVGEVFFIDGHYSLFTQEDMEMDTASPAEFRYNNTNCAPALPSSERVQNICRSLGTEIDMAKIVIVLGSARKAKLCHDECLLIQDFDRAAVQSGEIDGLDRVEKLLDFVDQDFPPQVPELLKQANRHTVYTQRLGRIAPQLCKNLRALVTSYICSDPLALDG